MTTVGRLEHEPGPLGEQGLGNMATDGSDETTASVTSIEVAQRRRRRRSEATGADALDRILDAGLELARLERDGHRLDEAELMALDCCDEIGGVRDLTRSDDGEPHPRDPSTASDDPSSPLYDF